MWLSTTSSMPAAVASISEAKTQSDKAAHGFACHLERQSDRSAHLQIWWNVPAMTRLASVTVGSVPRPAVRRRAWNRAGRLGSDSECTSGIPPADAPPARLRWFGWELREPG